MTDPFNTSHTAPKFAAPNPGALARWYENHLGFEVAVYAGGSYAIVTRGAMTLHIWQCDDRKIAENTACYTEIASVETLSLLHREWLSVSKTYGFVPGRIAQKITETAHGMCEFHLWDPAGNLISFGARD